MQQQEAKQAVVNALPELWKMFAHAENELNRALEETEE